MFVNGHVCVVGVLWLSAVLCHKCIISSLSVGSTKVCYCFIYLEIWCSRFDVSLHVSL